MKYEDYHKEYLSMLLFSDFCSNWRMGMANHNAMDRCCLFEMFDYFSQFVSPSHPDFEKAKNRYEADRLYADKETYEFLCLPDMEKQPSVVLTTYIDSYVDEAMEEFFERREKEQKKLDEIKERLFFIGEWNIGRAMHDYESDEEFAKGMSKQYEEDVEWLMKRVRHMKPSDV